MAAHILIIEDNDMSFVLADYLLRQAGYSISRAVDGEAGVQAALRNVADLILCDLDLPVMDGYQVAGTLRKYASWRRVPLLAFTGDSPGNPQAEALARQAGFEQVSLDLIYGTPGSRRRTGPGRSRRRWPASRTTSPRTP